MRVSGFLEMLYTKGGEQLPIGGLLPNKGFATISVWAAETLWIINSLSIMNNVKLHLFSYAKRLSFTGFLALNLSCSKF